MDPLSILCVLIGTLIVATRGPLILAPTATLRFFKGLLSTNARIRLIAIVGAPMAVALITLPLGNGVVAGILRVFGWVWATATLWLLTSPDSYRRVSGGLLGFIESSVPEAILRMIGVVAVAIGIALIYFGVNIRVD